MSSRFPATDWPLVVASRAAAEPPGTGALAELCGAYWQPVYAYLKQRGHRAEEAEDLTQGFFAHVLAHRVLEQAAPERGRLRSLLLTSLVHYVSNQQARLRAKKRGGPYAGATHVRPDDTDFGLLEPSDRVTPETIYERQWAIALLRRVLSELRAELADEGKSHIFEALKRHLVGDAAVDGYRDAAATLQISEAAARVTVYRLRRRYRELLSLEVARTLRGPSPDVAAELRHLLSVVQRGRPAG
jgi:DNA-directed RNA polymerase specialized sigma24 family protein